MSLISGYCCDKCERSIIYNTKASEWLPSKRYLMKFAREEGWSIGKNILCPKCRRNKRIK